MPFVGDPVQVIVVGTPFGSMVTLWNRSGTRREFTVAGRLVAVDGNTRAGLVIDERPGDLVVLEGDERVWPVPPLDSLA